MIRDALLNTRLPNDLKQALLDLAQEDNRSLGNYVEKVLAAHVGAERPGSVAAAINQRIAGKSRGRK